VLRRIFGPKTDEVMGDWKKNCMMRRFVTYTPSQISLV
jgi:hypothetical protein